MNSTHSYSIHKIQGKHPHFIFSFTNEGITRKILFSNAAGFEKRMECIGVECSERNVPDEIYSSKIRDNSNYGEFIISEAGRYKITFSINNHFLKGNYVLLRPSWSRDSTYSLWKLIPANTL